jgi:pyrroloquinoline quinone biosynthesis protein D
VCIDASAVPRLKSGIRLQFNQPRGKWVVQAPERVLMPDDIALAVLKRCDGETRVESIAEALAEKYNAPRAAVECDIVEMLQDLADKGIIADVRER